MYIYIYPIARRAIPATVLTILVREARSRSIQICDAAQALFCQIVERSCIGACKLCLGVQVFVFVLACKMATSVHVSGTRIL